MLLQMTLFRAFVVALGAAEGFTPSVGSLWLFKLLDTKHVVTLEAIEWFISSVGPFMFP